MVCFVLCSTASSPGLTTCRPAAARFVLCRSWPKWSSCLRTTSNSIVLTPPGFRGLADGGRFDHQPHRDGPGRARRGEWASLSPQSPHQRLPSVCSESMRSMSGKARTVVHTSSMLWLAAANRVLADGGGSCSRPGSVGARGVGLAGSGRPHSTSQEARTTLRTLGWRWSRRRQSRRPSGRLHRAIVSLYLLPPSCPSLHSCL